MRKRTEFGSLKIVITSDPLVSAGKRWHRNDRKINATQMGVSEVDWRGSWASGSFGVGKAFCAEEQSLDH
jgi:hypothetical protein